MPTVAIALLALALTIAVHAAGLLIWGASLTQRVRRLEDDAEPLKALPERLARAEEREGFLFTAYRDLGVVGRSQARAMQNPTRE